MKTYTQVWHAIAAEQIKLGVIKTTARNEPHKDGELSVLTLAKKLYPSAISVRLVATQEQHG